MRRGHLDQPGGDALPTDNFASVVDNGNGIAASTSIVVINQDGEVEVRRWRQFAVERGGGVLLNFSSSLDPEVPVANINAFYEEAYAVEPVS